MHLDTLLKWNRWGENPLNSGLPRQIITSINPFLHSEEIVALTGLRRSGKSTIMYQIMDRLVHQGIEQRAMLHINFEEPALAPLLKLSLLDELYDTYRAEIYPQGRAYLFLDEIQNLPEWERWVRARNETEDIKIFITGSSSQLLSRELGTLLTGRHVNFNIFPLNLAEVLQFRSIELPKKPWPFSPPAIIENTIKFLLTWGSLPKIVLADDAFRRQTLLLQYFDDILLKDIAMRHNVRDMSTLRGLAVHLLTQTGSLVSFGRLAKIFNVSTILIQNYCNYIEEAFLTEFLPFFSLKTALRQRNPQKIHATDLGIRDQISLSHSMDKGRAIESLVYNCLRQKKHDGIFYWKKTGEVDLCLRHGNTITALIQVVADGLDNDEIFKRELNAIKEGLKKFPRAKALIITGQRVLTKNRHVDKNIQIVPLWQFLLDPSLWV